MAARYWVGGTGTWDAADTSHWSATSGGASGASVPGSGDTVTFDGSSGGGTVTVGYNPNVTSITMGAFTGTLDFNTRNPTMQTFNNSGSGTRTLTMGSGTWTITGSGATIWNIGTTTGLTFTATTAVVNCTYAGSVGTRVFTVGVIDFSATVNVTAGSDTFSLQLTTGGSYKDINFTGFTGTLGAGSGTGLDILGSLTLGAGMSTGAVDLARPYVFKGSASRTLSSNSVVFNRPITVDGVGTTLQLSDALTTDPTCTVTLTKGTLDTNGQTCSWGLFSSSNSNTRVLTLGASTISLTATGTVTPWNCSTSTNMTLNAGTSTISFATSGQAPTFQGGGLTYYNVSVTATSGGFTLGQSNTFNNFYYAQGSGNRTLSLGTATTQTVNGVVTLTGLNANQSRLRVQSNTTGTQCTFALGTTGTASLTNVDFSDIAFTGTNAPVSGTSLGDAQGNSGITFTTPVTRYWVGGTGSMSDSTKWSATSGGASGASVPIAHDTVVFDANSFGASGQTVTQDIYRVKNVDFSAVTNNPTWSFADTSANGFTIFGNLTMGANMAVTCTSAVGSDVGLTLAGRGSQTWTNAGITWGTGFSFTVSTVGGIYTLQDHFTMSDASRTFTFSQGTFNANGFNVTCGLFSSSNSNTRTLNMGSGTWTLTGTGTIWNFGTTTNLTYDAGTSQVVVTDTSATTKSLNFANATIAFNVLTIPASGSGVISFSNTSGTRDINVLRVYGTNTLRFAAGQTYEIRNFDIPGNAGTVSFVSATPATQYTLSNVGGLVRLFNVNITDAIGAGGAYWQAINSTDGGNNTNINFVTERAPTMRVGQKFTTFGGTRPYKKALYGDLHHYRKLGG